MAQHLSELLGGDNADRPVTIYIVRHGDTKFNSDGSGAGGKIRGWSDVCLTARGKKEAQQAALRLKGKRIAGIDASDLPRGKETAEIIGKVLGIKPEFSADLRTLNTGDFTGHDHEKAQPKIDDFIRKPDEQIPGGESFNAFVTRVFRGFAAAAAKHPGQPIVIVSHHSPVSVIEAWEAKGQPADHSLEMRVYFGNDDPPGGIVTLHTTEAALKGNGMRGMSNVAFDMDNPGSSPGLDAPSPRQQFMDKVAQGAQQQQPAGGNMRDVMAHGRAIAGAKALHAVGHISETARDKHIAKSQKAIGAARKPFGAFAPS